MSELCYRGGATAIARVRASGLAGQVRVFVAPATGPKWLIAYGFDRALIEGRVLQGPVPTLLAGASAGAWRAMSLASPHPAKMHERLMLAYCHQVFQRRDTPATILGAYAAMLRDHFGGLEHALAAGTTHELAIHTARVRGSARARSPRWHLAALGAAALLNPLAPDAQALALERVTFHTAGASAALRGLRSRLVPLTQANLLEAALASGSVPLAMEPVRAIPEAPTGSYLDGGMTDYHIAAPYAHEDGVTLLFSHQPRIFARWLDQKIPWRRPGRRLLDTLVHVYPSPDFVARLPGGRVPTREDYVELADRPGERIRRWKEAVRASEVLAEIFLRDLASGGIVSALRPHGA